MSDNETIEGNHPCSRCDAAEAERDEVAGRLSALLCELTGGRLSKTNYDVPTMVAEIDSAYDDAHQEDRAERDRLAGVVERVRAYRADKCRLLVQAIDPEVRDWLEAITKDLGVLLVAGAPEAAE